MGIFREIEVESTKFEMNALSEAIGVPVQALTLVGSLFASYPLAFIHRYLFWGKSATTQNLFFATTGIGLIYSQVVTAKMLFIRLFVRLLNGLLSSSLDTQNFRFISLFSSNLDIYLLDMPTPKLKDMTFAGQCRAVLCAFV